MPFKKRTTSRTFNQMLLQKWMFGRDQINVITSWGCNSRGSGYSGVRMLSTDDQSAVS